MHSGYKTGFIISTILLSCLKSSFCEVVISEVMYNPQYDDDKYEFVEIYNLSTTAVDLEGWKLGDGSGDDFMLDTGAGLILEAGQFGLILDPDYFPNEPLYSYLIPANCLILTVESSTLGDNGLKNDSPETITLTDQNGIIVAQYTYSSGNLSGHSDEKIILSGGDNPLNWGESVFIDGTPGFANSISPHQHNLKLESFTYSPENPKYGDILTLSAEVFNAGTEGFADFQVGFFLDIDGDSLFSDEEMLSQATGSNLSSGESEILTFATGELLEIPYYFCAKILTEDDYPRDDSLTVSVYVGSETGALVFNEVMYKPLPGQAEWVELYNRSNHNIYVANWIFSDSEIFNSVILSPAIIPPDEYLVLAADSSLFDFPGLDESAEIMILDGFPSLNNDGDALYIIAISGNIVDSLTYPADWGKADNGVSMARINPFTDAGLSNWLPSAAEWGSSPGGKNSVFFQADKDDWLGLKAEPEIFYPDGSIGEGITTIKVKLPFPSGRINLRIFDVRGRLIRFLVKGVTIGVNSEHIWDGKKDNGEIVRLGPYIIHLEAISEPFAEKAEAKAVVVVGKRL